MGTVILPITGQTNLAPAWLLLVVAGLLLMLLVVFSRRPA
jgi:hypothetical protein